MNELVTVIIPMKNAAPWIGDAVASLRGQSIESWRAIVVDNGSGDRSIEAAELAAGDDPRFSIVRGSPEGPSEARNAGLERARGRHVLFLDADDWLWPRALEVLVRGAERSPGGAAYGAIEWRDERGGSLGWSCADGDERIGLDRLLEGNAFPIHGAIIARERLGGQRFDASLTVAEDHDLWLRLAAKGVEWAPVGETVGAYRLRPGSLTRDPSRWVTAWRAVITSAFRRARTRGWDARGVDVSPGRQRRTLNRIALELATRAAPHDRSGRAEACAAIFRAGAFPMKFGATDGASAAYWHMPHAMCLPPSAWRARARELCPPLARWWERAASEGWAPGDVAEEGTGALGALAAGADAAVRCILREVRRVARPDERVILVGLGRNAAALCPRLAEAGIAHAGFDDRPIGRGASGRSVSVAGREVALVGPEALGDSTGVFVVTPMDDAPLVARLPARARLVRWSRAARDGAEETVRSIRAAWPDRGGIVGRLEGGRRGEAAA